MTSLFIRHDKGQVSTFDELGNALHIIAGMGTIVTWTRDVRPPCSY